MSVPLAAADKDAPAWRDSPWFPLVLAVPFVLLYGLNGRTLLTGDSQAHLYLAASLAWSGDARLDEFTSALFEAGGGTLPYFAFDAGDGIRSIFNFFPALLLVPFYWVGGFLGGSGFRESLAAWGLVGKLAASLWIFAAGFPLWELLRRRVGAGMALTAVAAFWFATPLWGGSVDYLQHQPLMFFKLMALWAVFGRGDGRVGGGGPVAHASAFAKLRRTGRVAEVPDAEGLGPRFFLAGVMLALSVLCRYQTALGAAVLAVLVLVRHRREPRAGLLVAGGLLPVPLALLYHNAVFGSPFQVGPMVWLQFDQPLAATLFALLFNPGKGLLVHSPWLMLGVVAWRLIGTGDGARRWMGMALAASALPTVLLYGKLNGWYGGWCWGYRYLLDALPELIVLAALGLAALWQRGCVGRAVTGAALAAGLAVQTLGALAYDGSWHRRFDLGGEPGQAWLWQWRNGELAYHVRRGLVYVGSRPVALRDSPYETRGLYAAEDWGDRRVSWTGARAQLVAVARRWPMELHLFPNPSDAAQGIVRVRVRVDGGPVQEVHLPQGAWTTLPLGTLAWQHGARVEMEVEPVFVEPGGLERSLGVAVDLGAFGGRSP
ncbi:MAG: hypothetical protein KF858_05265 [Candidatus Sumerlaeia bacterium]|nr:hypothetical protein [Candidatus Sumerlaeia bacterium]